MPQPSPRGSPAPRIEALVADLLPAARPDGREMVCGSLMGESGRSLRIALTGQHGGRWRDWASGEHGDALDLIARTRCGGDLPAAMRWAREWLGVGPAERLSTPRPEPAADVRHTTLADHGHRLWGACRAIAAADPAGCYLRARGCALPWPDGDLRWHPALRHPCGHVGPALVAIVTDIRDPDRWLTLHRTWIRTDGTKADVETPRLLLAGQPKAGGVIRLWPDEWATTGLGIAEGIETTLTLARGFTPVWSVIDAGNLGAFPVLPGIEALTVAVDHDAAGLKAFKTVAERWHAAGCDVRKVLVPSPGADLNDWARSVHRA